MFDHSRISAADRSHFFRHQPDYALLKNYLETRYINTGRVHWSPVELLAVGAGNLEEPLSILATGAETAASLQTEGLAIQLPDLLTLHLVELRDREELSPTYSFGYRYGFARDNTPGAAFLTDEEKEALPRYPFKPQFIDDYPAGFELKDGEYRFSEEVITLAKEAVQRGRFSTRIQDFIRDDTARYPVIFFNHVLTHLGPEGERVAYDLTTKTLERDGIIFMHSSRYITDPTGTSGTAKMVDHNPRFAHLQQIGPAVYKKVPNNHLK